jgi:hypothetical protein
MPNPDGSPAAGGADVNAVNGEIASLQEALALERAKNEVLLEQLLKAEDGLVEKDVEGFADVIPNEDRDFWRAQLMENRESAVGILNRMRNRAKPAETAPVATPSQPKPLHNRETAKPAVAAGGPAGGGEDRAAKLRNRAQEIARREGCSFTTAFRAAEQEFGDVR